MSFSDPIRVMARLSEIGQDIASRQNEFEEAAYAWFRLKREREKAQAETFLKAAGTVAEREAIAKRDTALVGMQEEAKYEALKAAMRTLETRASIGQSILRSQAGQ